MDYSQYYIQEFKKYIALQTSSINTIKNYLSDLRLFLSFIAQKGPQPLSPQSLPLYIGEDFINQYESYLSLANPPATTKRRVSSLKKFIDYCHTQGILPAQPQTSTPIPMPTPTTPSPIPTPYPYSYPEPVSAPTPIPTPTPAPQQVAPPLPPEPTPAPPPIIVPVPITPIHPEPMNFYQPNFHPSMSQSPFPPPQPQPQSPPPALTPSPTQNLVHSFESLMPDQPTYQEFPSTPTRVEPTETVREYYRESESTQNKKLVRQTPTIWTYVAISVISFLVCLGLTLLITLVILQ